MRKRSAYDHWSEAAPPLLALVYPYVLKGFHACMASGAHWAAAVLLALAFAAPLSGLLATLYLGGVAAPDRSQVSARLIALLAIAAPPMYTAAGVLLYIASDPVADTSVWLLLWGALLIWSFFARRSASLPQQPAKLPAALRIAHGSSALAILLLFLGMHLSNHLAGLFSEAAHRHLMDLFRTIYRAHVVEPMIVLLFLFQVVSGLIMLRAYASRAADFYRSLQLASGAYLVFFILGHMNSVFIYARRVARIKTDWDFATGAPAGMLHDAWNIRLLPHYYLGVAFVLIHLIMGARVVALSHGMRRATADSFSKAGIAGSALIALLILMGMCGVHLGAGDGVI